MKKPLATRFDYFYFIYFPIIAACFGLSYFLPGLLFICVQVISFAALIALIIVTWMKRSGIACEVIPAKAGIQETNLKQSIQLILLPLAMSFIFLTISNNLPNTSNPILQLKTFLQWGLFPWSLMVLLGILIAHAQLSKKYFLPFGDSYRPLFPNKADGILNIGSELFARQNLICVFSMTIILLVTSLNKIIFHNNFLQVNHFTITTLISQFIFLLIATTPASQKFFRSLWDHHFGLGSLFLLLCVIIFCVIALSSFLSNTFPALNNFSFDLTNIIKPSNATETMLFAWGWWLGWMPLLVRFIAKTTEKIGVKKTFCYSLIMPLIILLLTTCFSPTNFTNNPITEIFFTLISIALLFLFLQNSTTAKEIFLENPPRIKQEMQQRFTFARWLSICNLSLLLPVLILVTGLKIITPIIATLAVMDVAIMLVMAVGLGLLIKHSRI